MNGATKINRIDELESLRGVMALWVLLGHVALTFDRASLNHLWWWNLLEANQKAVDLFIILSGFVIFHLLRVKPEPYGYYLYRRFLRLFPAYFVCLLISIMMVPSSLQSLQMLDLHSARNAARIQIFTDSVNHFWPQVIAHLTMLHGLIPSHLLPSTDFAFMGQAWSISVEWQFYLLAPFVYILAHGRRWWGMASILMGLGLLMILQRFFGDAFIGAHVVYFAIGCASSFLWSAKSEILSRVTKYSDLIIPLGTLFIIIVFRHNWQLAIWFCVLASCFTTRLHGSDQIVAHFISRLLTTAPLRRLGRISYSFYLIHMMALYAMLWLLRDLKLSQINLMLLTLTGTLSITLVAAYGSYKWIELPFIELGRRLRPRRVEVESEGLVVKISG